MNTQANAIPESFESQRAAPAVLPTTRPFYWSVRRELWENRYIYIAPVVVGTVYLVGFLISAVHLPEKMRAVLAGDPAQYRAALGAPYDLAAAVMMAATILVSVFYSIDALHGERRDRSILFWKSLPVSDVTTVLAKASIPLLVVPVVAFLVAAAMQLIMLLLSSVVLLLSGVSAAVLWTHLGLLKMWWLLLYHLLTAHALWPAPIYCWLILVSGWARRAAFLWAALPVIAIGGLEQIVWHTSHFVAMVGGRIIGDAPANAFMPDDVFPTAPMTHITPGTFLGSPEFLIGLAVCVVFLAAAVRLRRYRGPI